MIIETPQSHKGFVEAVIQYRDGRQEKWGVRNTILRKGREALVKSLANQVSNVYSFYIARMIFGDGGTSGGTIKFVSTERNGLYGITRATKSVISSIDAAQPTQGIFTSVLAYSEANGFVLNEMALVMSTGDLYSMTTFPDLTKTDQMQITWNWRLSFV